MSPRRAAGLVALTVSVGVLTAALTLKPTSTTKNCSTVLDSEVCAWITMDGDRAVELGLTVPIALVEAVAMDAPMTWPPEELAGIELPAKAKEVLGLQRLGINWEAHGHPPATFMTPHFDFHIYNITSDQVGAIDCADLAKPDAVPDGYTLPDIEIPDMGTLVGLCVPLMGMHAMPATDMTVTDAFEGTMIVGYYGGEPIFFEPMVAQSMLLKRKSFTLPMPSVDELPEGVHYPHEFNAQYDAASRQYRFVFTRFDAIEG